MPENKIKISVETEEEMVRIVASLHAEKIPANVEKKTGKWEISINNM